MISLNLQSKLRNCPRSRYWRFCSLVVSSFKKAPWHKYFQELPSTFIEKQMFKRTVSSILPLTFTTKIFKMVLNITFFSANHAFAIITTAKSCFVSKCFIITKVIQPAVFISKSLVWTHSALWNNLQGSKDYTILWTVPPKRWLLL